MDPGPMAVVHRRHRCLLVFNAATVDDPERVALFPAWVSSDSEERRRRGPPEPLTMAASLWR